MTYLDAECFLLSLFNLPRREYMNDPQKTGLYLKRLQFFLDLIGNPEKKIPHYIHVTGTSGKGSVATFLASILEASGKKTGLMISPHPTDLRERWQVNERPMRKAEFAGMVERIKPALDQYERESPYDALSFFDLTTAIGFLYFSKQRVSWAVVEVGCGGRYDSTNVIPKKDVAVITNIGLDHTETLGNTKEKIAYEKAGIITPGCAVFTMERNVKIRRIVEKECKKNNTRLSSIMHHLSSITTGADGTTFSYHGNTYRLTAPGAHQAKNAALCIDIARYIGVRESAIQKGLATARQPLRMEIGSQNPLIILDGAHNPDKMKTTVETTFQLMRRQNELAPSPYEGEVSRPAGRRGSARDTRRHITKKTPRVHLTVGFSADKHVRAMIRQLAELRPASVACTRNTVNPFRKAALPRDIEKEIKKHLPKTKTAMFLDPLDAFRWSRARMNKHDALLATGSIFLSGELRGAILPSERQ